MLFELMYLILNGLTLLLHRALLSPSIKEIMMGTKTQALLDSEREYKTKIYSEDDAIEFLQTIPSRLLGQVLKYEIDLNKLAGEVLANRGHNAEGEWIGFKRQV